MSATPPPTCPPSLPPSHPQLRKHGRLRAGSAASDGGGDAPDAPEGDAEDGDDPMSAAAIRRKYERLREERRGADEGEDGAGEVIPIPDDFEAPELLQFRWLIAAVFEPYMVGYVRLEKTCEGGRGKPGHATDLTLCAPCPLHPSLLLPPTAARCWTC